MMNPSGTPVFRTLCLLASLASGVAAQTPPTAGPYVHRVCSASSPDGLTWTRDEGTRVEHASVPCAVALETKILLYYVDADRGAGKFESAGCSVSTDGIHFEKRPFAIEGLLGRKALDPSVVRDPQGKYWLYYFVCERDPGAAGAHSIRVAVSERGLGFVDKGEAFSREGLVDPDVFFYRGKWFMYVFGKGNTVIATSDDGFQFTYLQDLDLRGYGTVAPVELADGRLRLYAFEQQKPSANAVRSFVSTDGILWEKEDGVRLQAGPDEAVTDPFVVRWKDGWKMYFKIEPRHESGRGPGPGTPGRPGPDTPGPWDADVLVYRVSPDGDVEKTATFGRAGVPTLARLKDGRLIAAHQHFPENNDADFDKVAVRFSGDEGRTWTAPEVVRLDGLPEGMRFPFDPTLVPLPDGRVRLYFTSTRGRTFEQGMPGIYSAISDDGVRYVFEPGARFAIDGRMVIDCAVVLHKETFHLFSPDNGAPKKPGEEGTGDRGREGVGHHAVSEDGLAFTRLDDVKVEGRRRWLGNAQSDGKRITFYGTGEPPEWTWTSEDGKAWTLAAAPAVPGADPGACATKDGGLVIVTTGAPRPGTPSARKRK